ncbi:MAG TPA: AMP-binding protein [Trebonia sp.]|nr:AMP-binding protein [Trebonia sp.]
MLMRQILSNAAWATPEAVAIRDGAAVLTYAELDDRVHRLASALYRRGCASGQRVALMAENSFRYFEWYFGCCESGAVAVTVNTRWTAPEIAAYLELIEPRAVVADIRLRDLVMDVFGKTPSITDIFWFDSESAPGSRVPALLSAEFAGSHDYEDTIARAERLDLPPTDPDAPAVIAATSGTSGSYRGAVISQRATWAAGLGWSARLQFTSAERALIPLPLHFAGGSPNWTLAFFTGGQTIVLRKYSIDSFLATVAAHEATFAMLVPTMIYDIADQDPAVVIPALSTLRLIGTGGAPISADRLAQAIDVLGPRFTVAYGFTEACASGSVLMPEDYRGPGGTDLEILRTVGRPWPGVTLRVVGDDGRDVPHDGESQGEIVCYGPSTARGYFGTADEAGTFRGSRVFSGDLAVVHPNGCIRVVERRKDLIISGGINVVPREVEEAIASDPRVRAVAVVGVPHRRLGECVCAFVVPQPGQVLTADDIAAWCAARLASYKRPKVVQFTDQLPVNSTGKVVKRELAAQAAKTGIVE